MKRLFGFMLGCGILFTSITLTVCFALAQFPDPKDEAKLYELAKKEGTLVWYGNSPLEAMKNMAKDFESKYSGVRVEILRIVSVAGYQRFLQETNAKQYIADIPQINDYPSMKSLIEQGHFAEWKVPTSEDRIPAPFRIGNFCYSPWLTNLGIVYNVNKVTPEEIKILDSSWRGVLDPRFKGRFALTTMKTGTTYGGIHMLLDPKNAKVFGPDFIRAIAAQKPTVYSEYVVLLDRVVAGEHDFAFWMAESTSYLKWVQGAPIRWVHSDPTPVWGNSWFAISRYAPHPNAARLFLNWCLSDAGALSLMRNGYKPILEDVKDIRKVALEPWYAPIKTRYNVDWDRWARDFNKDMDFWIKTIMEGR